MPIIRYQEIGPGRDFATPQDWFNANRGDLVSSGLICIGYINEKFTYSGSGVALEMTGATTNQEHYYVVKGHRISSSSPVQNADIVLTSIDSSGGIYCDVAYTKLQGIGIYGPSGEMEFNTDTNGSYMHRYGIFCGYEAREVIVDACSVSRFYVRASGYGTTGTIHFHLILDGITCAGSGALVRNCFVSDLTSVSKPNRINNAVARCTSSAAGIRFAGEKATATNLSSTYGHIVNNTVRDITGISHGKSPFDIAYVNAYAVGIGILCYAPQSGRYIGFTINNAIFNISHWQSGLSPNGLAADVIWINTDYSRSGVSRCFHKYSDNISNNYDDYYPEVTYCATSDSSVPNNGNNLINADINDCLKSLPDLPVFIKDYTSPLIGTALPITDSKFANFNSTNKWYFNHDILGGGRNTLWDIGAHEFESEQDDCFDDEGVCIPSIGCPCDPQVEPDLASGLMPLYLHSPIPSGYIDLFLEATVNTPFSGIDLYTYGYDNTTANCTLFTEGNDSSATSYVTTGFTLFLLTTVTASGNDGMLNLFLKAPDIPSGTIPLYTAGADWVVASSGIPLYLHSGESASGFLNLFIDGKSTSGILDNIDTGSLNLFLQAADIPSGILPLYAVGNVWTPSGTFVPLSVVSTSVVSGMGDGSSMNLYINGIGTSGIYDSYLNLYIQGLPIPSGYVDLFTEGGLPPADPTWTTTSKTMTLFLGRNEDASGMMNLFLLGPTSDIVNATVPLFMEGSGASSLVDLFVHGKDFQSGTLNLIVGGGFPKTLGSGVNLFTWATSVGVSGLFSSVPLVLLGTGGFSSLNLFIGSPDSAIVTSNLNLFIPGLQPSLDAHLDLFVDNHGISSGLNLWIAGSPLDGGPITDLNYGWYIGQNNMNLYIETNSLATTVPLYIAGPGTPLSSGLTLYTSSIGGVLSSGINLYTRSDDYTTLDLYTHGF